MGCDALINAAPRPGIPGERKPLRCSGDGDGALHGRRVVLAVELVVAGRRGGEGDGGVLVALHVLVDVGRLEGEAVLGAVLVGDLDGVAGPGLEVQGGLVELEARGDELELVVAAAAGRGRGLGGRRGSGGRAGAPAPVVVPAAAAGRR